MFSILSNSVLNFHVYEQIFIFSIEGTDIVIDIFTNLFINIFTDTDILNTVAPKIPFGCEMSKPGFDTSACFCDLDISNFKPYFNAI